MWALKNAEGALFYVNPEKGLQVGRKQGDLVLPADESISRNHAKVSLANASELNHERDPTIQCFVKDTASKYGSFVIRDDKKEKVPKEDFPLRHLDKLQFGLQRNVFTVLHIPLIVTGSGLTNEEKAELKSLLAKVNGVVLDTWTARCTHLTVPRTTAMTQKVACALAQAHPIVTLNYWKDVSKAVAANQEFPKSSDYMASIGENAISKERVSLDCDSRRTELFKDKIFVHHTTTQYNFYARIIKAAGGKSLLYSKKPLNERELCAENVIILQLTEEASQTMNSTNDTLLSGVELIQQTLKKKNRRLVSDSEIPLAILYCSTERYCNPKYKFSTIFKQSDPKDKFKESQILAPDTQEVPSQPLKIREPVKSSFRPLATSTQQNFIIPESNSSSATLEEEEKHSEEISQILPPPMSCDRSISDTIIPETDEVETQEPTPKEPTPKVPLKQSLFSQNRLSNSTVGSQDIVEDSKRLPEKKKSLFVVQETPESLTLGSSNKVSEKKKSLFVVPETLESLTPESSNKDPERKKSLFVVPETLESLTPESSNKDPERKKSLFVVPETLESLTPESSKKRYRSEDEEEVEEVPIETKKVCSKDKVSSNRSIFSSFSPEKPSTVEVGPKKKVFSWEVKEEKLKEVEEPASEPEPFDLDVSSQVSTLKSEKIEDSPPRRSDERKFEEDKEEELVPKDEPNFPPVAAVYSIEDQEREKKRGIKRKMKEDGKEQSMDIPETTLYKHGQLKCVIVPLFREGYDQNNITEFGARSFYKNSVKIPKKRISLSDTYVYSPQATLNTLDEAGE